MKKGINFLAAVSLLLICGCIGWVVITAVSAPSSASLPAGRPPTAVPEPAPQFNEIRQNYKTMTEAQWENYAHGLRGMRINGWTGTVRDVDQTLGRYAVLVMVGGSRDNQLTVPVSEEVALAIDRGQSVTVSGQIDSVIWVFDLIDLALGQGARLKVE